MGRLTAFVEGGHYSAEQLGEVVFEAIMNLTTDIRLDEQGHRVHVRATDEEMQDFLVRMTHQIKKCIAERTER